jgi:YVTN family beta-propeller protein
VSSCYGFGRVYYASLHRRILLAIDAATDQVVGSIQSVYGLEGMVGHPQSGRVYCWSRDGCTALAIDPATNRVAGAIGIVPCPSSFELVAGGAKFYSGGEPDDCCWVVSDAISGERLKMAEISWYPEQFADYPAAGVVYGLFLRHSWHLTAVIDAVTDSIIDSLDLGRWQETQACADCGRMYFLRRAGDMLVGVDVAVNQVTSTIQSGSGGHLVYDVARSRLYLTRPDSGDVLVVDASGDSVVATIRGVGDGPNEMVFSMQDDRLFVANDVTGDVTVIDAGTGAIEARVPIGTGELKLAYDTTRSRLFCLDRGRKSISVLDCASLELVDSVQVDSTVYLLCWNQEYRRLYAGGRGFVYAIREGVPAIEGGPGDARQRSGSTITRGTLRLPGRAPAWLLDISGRRVMDLAPGENDVSRIAPGVYFVVAEQDRAVSKVILQR